MTLTVEHARILRGILDRRQPRPSQRFDTAHLIAKGYLRLLKGVRVGLTATGLREAGLARRATTEGRLLHYYDDEGPQ